VILPQFVILPLATDISQSLPAIDAQRSLPPG